MCLPVSFIAVIMEHNVPVVSNSLCDLGYVIFIEGSCSADVVCMHAILLREMLIVRGRSVEELSSRRRDLYKEMVDLLGTTTFQGSQGLPRYREAQP